MHSPIVGTAGTLLTLFSGVMGLAALDRAGL